MERKSTTCDKQRAMRHFLAANFGVDVADYGVNRILRIAANRGSPLAVFDVERTNALILGIFRSEVLQDRPKPHPIEGFGSFLRLGQHTHGVAKEPTLIAAFQGQHFQVSIFPRRQADRRTA
jgi:hypothetical protein